MPKKTLTITIEHVVFPSIQEARRYTELVYKDIAHGTGFIFLIQYRYLNNKKQVRDCEIEWGHEKETEGPSWKSGE